MKYRDDEHEDELTDAALGISRAKRVPEWRPSDAYQEHHNESPWMLLIGVFLAGVVSGVALAIFVSQL